MRKELFLDIVKGVCEVDSYFEQKRDAVGAMGFSPLMKCTVAMRILAYGAAFDEQDENFRIAESTVAECFEHFCDAVLAAFEEKYVCDPTRSEVAKELELNAKRGFPGLFGSLDCSRWEWKQCPKAWAGAFRAKEKTSTIVLEASSTYNLRFWYRFVGLPGALNDRNVLDQGQFKQKYGFSISPAASFYVNGTKYDGSYALTDGSYPDLPFFVNQNDLSTGHS